jgi:hypothetical protein
MKVLFTFILLSGVCFAQNKKEQIEILNFRVDSLNKILAKERNSFNDKNNALNKTIQLQKSEIELVKKELVTKQTELDKQITETARVSKLLIKAQTEIEQLIVLQSSNSFTGSWCNNDFWDEEGELFNLDISTDEKGIINACFYSGGPFQECYIGKLSTEGNLDLFYDSAGGSISFNEAISSADKNLLLNCKKTKYAICKLIELDKIQIITYENNCSYMPSNMKIVLKKLKEDESCYP